MANIKCGCCKARHASAADVRACYEEMRAEEALSRAIWENENAAERWYEERGGSTYAGSREEAEDRFYDSYRLTPA